jgi:alkaline phosphatase D
LYLRKDGSDGWFLASALLFANSFSLPVIGNSRINQFLDNSNSALRLSEWSTRSLSLPSVTPARFPPASACYRLAGPVLGQLSATSANVVYRVEREGHYRLEVTEVSTGATIFSSTKELSPTGIFRIDRLAANTHYAFRFFFIRGTTEIHLPEGDGEFRTFPPEDVGVRFTFAFGSCARNRYDPEQPAWLAMRNLAADPASDTLAVPWRGIRFFLHLGDTFYFHDDMTNDEPETKAAAEAANLSARKHRGFLEMARVIPSIAVWDDHDFRYDGKDSTNYPAKDLSLAAFLEYWGNDLFVGDDGETTGLTTRLTYGNVDVYLMDGRYHRDKGAGVCFTQELLRQIVFEIRERAARGKRLVILASGSTWNHTTTEGEPYGESSYDLERESFYRQLHEFIGSAIYGLVFLSGDIHQSEIYEIELVSSDGAIKRAPEFVSSPLAYNSSLRNAKPIEGERRRSFTSKGSNGRRGFGTLEIDTTALEPEKRWTLRLRFHDEKGTSTTPYHTEVYTLKDGQFAAS